MHWLLIGYMFLFIHRPFEVWPALGEIRLELLYMLVTGIVWLVHPGKRWPGNPLHFAIAAFAAAMVICCLASPWNGESFETVERYLKLLVFYLMLVTVVHDEASLRRLALAFLAVMTLYMAHSLWEYHNGRHEYRMSIVRMVGVDKSLGDPNSFGASIVYALPFVVPFWCCTRSWLQRAFLASYVGLSSVCIVLTGSRSSFLGLLVFAAITVWFSRRRWQAVGAGIVSLPLLWAVVPGSMQTRFETIIHPEVGPANAQVSAESRLEGLYKGLDVWAEHPLTGCGPGAWKWGARTKMESHNLYGQLVGEMGTLGLITFVLMLGGFWYNLRLMRRWRREHEAEQTFLPLLARAIGVAVFLMLLEGNFGHNLYRFTWLWYGGFLLIATHCIRAGVDEAIELGQEAPWGMDRELVPWMSAPY
jgi:O-antigen ligase